MKSGNLNFLEPSGPLQVCNRTVLPTLDKLLNKLDEYEILLRRLMEWNGIQGNRKKSVKSYREDGKCLLYKIVNDIWFIQGNDVVVNWGGRLRNWKLKKYCF
jgi:hypothetical protein